MRRKLTTEQQRRRRAEYSVRATALCIALMVVLACIEQPEEPVEPKAEPEIVTEVPAEQEVEEVPEPVEPRSPLADWHKMEGATLTHYCICKACCGKDPEHPDYGITASGREAEPYTSIAVDPVIIPLGSYVLIEYENGEVLVGRADDTGSAIDGSHLDLCVSTHSEAQEEGVKVVDVYWKEEINILEN